MSTTPTEGSLDYSDEEKEIITKGIGQLVDVARSLAGDMLQSYSVERVPVWDDDDTGVIYKDEFELNLFYSPMPDRELRHKICDAMVDALIEMSPPALTAIGFRIHEVK